MSYNEMLKSTPVVEVIATVEHTDGRVEYVTWRNRAGSTIADLKTRIRAHYATRSDVSHVGLGNGISYRER
jgi:hypothetical protein